MEISEMKTTFSKYPAYKDSSEYWLGEVPKHWELKKLKHIFREKKKVTNTSLNCGSISFGRVVYKDDEKITESTKSSYQEVLEGEFLINPLNLNYDLVSLRIGLSQINVVVSSGYIVLKNVIEINKSYFNYLLHRYDVAYMKLLGSGVRQTISFTHIANSILALPPLSEQTAIATFLDDKTTKIDLAIAQKEKTIALLKEHKQILIQNAVTKGLDPNAKMKDSGVEWIGEIPDHWTVPKLKYVCQFILDGTHGSYVRVENGYRLLSVRNIINNEFVFRDDDSMVSEKHFKEISSKFLICNGDIQLAIVGATLGKVAMVKKLTEKIVTQRSLSTIRVNKKVLNSYLFFYLQSDLFQSFLWNNTGFSAQPGIYLGTIQNSNFPLPGKNEQQQILEFIENSTNKIATAISLKEQEIEKLKEYKMSLIDEVVTGKVKVC